jgi:hypothetical protein
MNLKRKDLSLEPTKSIIDLKTWNLRKIKFDKKNFKPGTPSFHLRPS